MPTVNYNTMSDARKAGLVRPSELAEIPKYRGFQFRFESGRVAPDYLANPLGEWGSDAILKQRDDLPSIYVSAYLADEINNINERGAFVDLIDTSLIEAAVNAARALIDRLYRAHALKFRPHLPADGNWKFRFIGLVTTQPAVEMTEPVNGAIGTHTTVYVAKNAREAVVATVDMQRKEWTGPAPETTLEEDVEWILAQQSDFVRELAQA